ncbi:hypothetical protein V1514DRAFT_337467 [Lipomyces japonicus]|uniref:uncharacterized protein n=1 Tax=Lipomyces japonicus TaxID=56871 RepID=UPI0034CE2747
MPSSKLPSWLASQIGLGVANALVLGYRSYQKFQFVVKTKIWSFVGADYDSSIEVTGRSPYGMSAQHNTESLSVNGQSVDQLSVTTNSSVFDGRIGRFIRASKFRKIDRMKTFMESSNVALFYLKPEPNTDDRIIYVYNNQAEKVYVFLQPDVRSDTWTLAYSDARIGTGELATIYVGKHNGFGSGTGIISPRAHPGKYILFNNPNGGLTYRKVIKQWSTEYGHLRTFYLSGSSPYHWTKDGFLLLAEAKSIDFFVADTSAMDLARAVNTDEARSRRRTQAQSARSEADQPAQAGTPNAAVIPTMAPREAQPEVLAHAARIAKGMTWRMAIDTGKISPEVVLATAWISIRHQWSSRITVRGEQLPEGV